MAEERDFSEFKVLMLCNKLRDCPLLDNLSDEDCVLKFRFRKKHIKVLARILKIKPIWNFSKVVSFIDQDLVSTRKKLITSIICDPIIQLMVYLHRKSHGTPIHHLECFFGFSKTKLHYIERAVC